MEEKDRRKRGGDAIGREDEGMMRTNRKLKMKGKKGRRSRSRMRREGTMKVWC